MHLFHACVIGFQTNGQKKISPRYINILDASKSGKKIVRSFLSPTEQESVAPYIINIVIEDSYTDSHLSYVDSLLLERKYVYCTINFTICPIEEVRETKNCPKYKSKRSSKIYSAKKASKKQFHQVEPNDVHGKVSTSKMSTVDDQSNTSKQIKALQEHVDKKFVELENMLSNLDRKLENIKKVLNISCSTKRRLNEPTTVLSGPKKKKTQTYAEGTTVVTRGDQVVIREQEVVIEPLTSPLTHPDNTIHKVTYVTRDEDGVTREQDVVFETSNNTTHHDEPLLKKKIIVYTRSKKKNTNIHEPQKTFIDEGGDEKVAQGSPIADRDVFIEPDMTIGGDAAAMTTSEKPLPQEITPLA